MNQTDNTTPARSILTTRFLRRALFFITVAAVGVVIGLPLLLGFGRAWAFLHPACGYAGRTPSQFGLNSREIQVTMRDGKTLGGWYLPGTLPALILNPPAYGSFRDGNLDELAPLAKAGYHVLVWDSRACTGGSVSLGASEAVDIGDVLNFVRTNPDKLPLPLYNTLKIALHGFSAGGAAATMATALYPEVTALLSEGGYHNWDQVSVVSYEPGFLGQMFGIGGNLAYQLTTGFSATRLSPIESLRAVAPRPVFLVYGELEPSLEGAKLQYRFLGGLAPAMRKGLWIVPNAEHGFYAHIAGDEYHKRVRSFYDCALLGNNDACSTWDSLLTRLTP